jgi:hypothetical protein
VGTLRIVQLDLCIRDVSFVVFTQENWKQGEGEGGVPTREPDSPGFAGEFNRIPDKYKRTEF